MSYVSEVPVEARRLAILEITRIDHQAAPVPTSTERRKIRGLYPVPASVRLPFLFRTTRPPTVKPDPDDFSFLPGLPKIPMKTTSSSTGSKGSKVVASTMATPKGSGHDFHFEEEDDQALPGAPGAHEVEDGSSDDDAKTDTSDEDDEDYDAEGGGGSLVVPSLVLEKPGEVDAFTLILQKHGLEEFKGRIYVKAATVGGGGQWAVGGGGMPKGLVEAVGKPRGLVANGA